MENNNKFVMVVVCVVVATLLITSFLVPVIANSDTQITKRTDLNNTGTPLIMGDVADDYTIKWDSALPSIVVVNGTEPTVFFVAGDGGTVSPTQKTVTTGLTYGDLPTPTRTGYTFDGWFTSTQYTTEITEDSVVEGKSNITLYAKWIANTYTVTFDAGDGTVSTATKTVTYGQPYGELPVPEYTGHNFAGWFDANDNPISSASIVSIAEDHTLYADYTLGQYLVSFTTDGNGTVDVQNVTVDYGTAYTISGNTVVIGETTVTATGTSPYSFSSWTPATSGTVEGAMTFIANFVLPPVTITFTAPSPATVDTATYTDVPRGTQYVVSDNTVTVTGFGTVTASLPDGYYMTGWNVAQGVGTVTDTMTFTAQYELIEIAKVVCSANTTWIITEDGKLYGAGYNSNGQQGDGTTTDVKTFTQRLSTETVADVVCEDQRTWALTTDGKLFGCGVSTLGQQGDGTTMDVTTFTQTLSTEIVAKVVCSGATTWALTTDGKLFGCGQGTSGQQGNSSTVKETTFTQRLSTETIADVVCSNNTTWALTTDGKLFGCGKNNYGQQGDGTTTDVTTFTQRLSTETIAKVVCSANTTWALTTDGKLFGTGYNNKGQQGDGTTTDVTTFTQRLSTETIAKVVCSNNTTWALTTDGKLFGCGDNTYGQNGVATPLTITSFTQRLTDKTIATVSCSTMTTWIVTTDGKLFGCGDNSSKQQGDGTTSLVKSFTQRLSTETIAISSISAVTTWALTTDGKLFGCGYGSYGQQSSGGNTSVDSFNQRGVAGSVNIPVALPILTPITPVNPFTPIPILVPMSVTPSDIVGTDFIFHAGGENWMLCTVSVGVDQYALALFYEGLTDPFMWDDDVELLFSNGELTFSYGGQSYTMNYDSIFYKGNGDYLLTDTDAYVGEDTIVIGFGIPVAGAGVEVIGTVSDYESVSIADGSITLGEGLITSTDTEYDGFSIVTEVSATYDSDQTVVCSSVIVPKKVTVVTVVEDHTMDMILSIIPLLMVVGVLMTVVGTIIYRRV